jgi:positive regulator of sigma E activity
LKLKEGDVVLEKKKCQTCGSICSHKICKACELLDKLNKGKPKIQIEIPEESKS